MIPEDYECKSYRNYCNCPDCADAEDQVHDEEHSNE